MFPNQRWGDWHCGCAFLARAADAVVCEDWNAVGNPNGPAIVVCGGVRLCGNRVSHKLHRDTDAVFVTLTNDELQPLVVKE